MHVAPSVHHADQLTNEPDIPDEYKPRGARVINHMAEVTCKRNQAWHVDLAKGGFRHRDG